MLRREYNLEVKIRLLPRTRLGKWSLGLIAAMPVLIIAGTQVLARFYPEVPAGGTIVKDILARPMGAILALLGIFSGLGALVTSLIAVIRQKERGLLILAPIIFGLLLALLLLGEMGGPH